MHLPASFSLVASLALSAACASCAGVQEYNHPERQVDEVETWFDRSDEVVGEMLWERQNNDNNNNSSNSNNNNKSNLTFTAQQAVIGNVISEIDFTAVEPTLPIYASHGFTGSASSGSGCRGEPIAPGWHNVTLKVSSANGTYGQERTHMIRIPPAYDGIQPVPTLFGFHGSSSDPIQFLEEPPSSTEYGTGSHLDVLADQENFVLILPTGSVRFYNATLANQTGEQVQIGYGWQVPFVPSITSNTFDDPIQDDIAYILQILKHTQSTLCVDKKRSYASGHSGGGRMSSALACDPEASNHFAAVAPISGIRAGPADTAANLSVPISTGYKACRPARPIGIVTSHGGADTTNPYKGNTNPQWGYSVDTAVAAWRTLLGCGRQKVIEFPFLVNSTTSLPSVTRRSTSWCGEAGITLFFVTGHEHPWPSDVPGWYFNKDLWYELTRHTL